MNKKLLKEMSSRCWPANDFNRTIQAPPEMLFNLIYTDFEVSFLAVKSVLSLIHQYKNLKNTWEYSSHKFWNWSIQYFILTKEQDRN